jgi:hypothetical protein
MTGLLVAAGVIVLLVTVLAVPAALFVLRDRDPGPVAGGPTEEPAPARSGPAAPPPAPDTDKTEPPPAPPRPPDTGSKPPPVGPAPVAWKDYTSPDGRFAVRFPARPETTARRDGQGHPTQTFTAPLGRASFTVLTTDYPTPEQARQALDRLAETPPEGTRAARDVALDGRPGKEFLCDEVKAGAAWTTAHRAVAAGGRLYQLIASSPREGHDPAPFANFLDSFAVLDKSEPPPAGGKPPVKPARGLDALEVKRPVGWTASYNKFLGWTFARGPVASGPFDPDHLRVEEAPGDARDAETYAARLLEKDFLDANYVFTEITEKGKLPDGFLIKGVVGSTRSKREKPRLGLVMVREVGGVRLMAAAFHLRDEPAREEAVEMFRGARLP